MTWLISIVISSGMTKDSRIRQNDAARPRGRSKADGLKRAAGEGRGAAGEDPAKRRQILEGARRVFVSSGFDAASMNDVTREAGVSKSTLYVYFRSKEELFTALIAQERDRYFEAFVPILADAEHPETTLMRFGLALAQLSISPEAVHAKRTVIAVATRMPSLGRAFYRDGPERAHALLVAYLEKAVAGGRLSIDDISLAASQFIELVGAGLFRRSLFDDEAPLATPEVLERTVRGAVNLFLAGYGPTAFPKLERNLSPAL
ncbi:TetR/AcrR family transcriptional regulator [Aureimonas mangrovi]|uniref:TetR/AcrR family transcriptional regulator n=1 Tax=Aureimonas mangrovi TaxID=2758041 RepID=UPI001FEA7841|nr:TetR/AcrR family transcriptional regulator [Aureimonas mangrovi]